MMKQVRFVLFGPWITGLALPWTTYTVDGVDVAQERERN